jgi:hypothetical protein
MRQLYQQQLYASQQAQANNIPNGKEQISDQNQQASQQTNNNLSSQVEAEAQLLSEGLKSVKISDRENNVKEGKGSDEKDEYESEGEGNSCSSLAAASMWTRKDINEFKESVRSEGGEAVIRIGQGESVTVSSLLILQNSRNHKKN